MKRLIAVALMTSLVGCATTDPYTGEQKTSNTAKGAGIGALAGAVLGAAVNHDNRGKGALIGAALGGAAGGGYGHYMDKQEQKLRTELQGTGVQVQRQGDALKLIMPGSITFDTGRYDVRSSFFPTLDSVAQVINEYDKTAVKISGHTDSTGSSETNQRLSEQRADSVRAYLQSRGVAAGRLQAYGYGPRYPVASNDSASGRQTNRRVEIELLPMQ